MRERLGAGERLAAFQRISLALELLLAQILIDDDTDLGDHRLRREWFDYVVHRAVGVSLQDLLLLAADRRHEDDGRETRPLTLAAQRRRLETIELGHLDVEKNQ